MFLDRTGVEGSYSEGFMAFHRSEVVVWSKYSNAQRVSSLHLSEGCLNLASRSDTYFFRVRSSLPAARPGSRFEPAVRTPGGPVARHPQPRGRKPILRREIPNSGRDIPCVHITNSK